MEKKRDRLREKSSYIPYKGLLLKADVISINTSRENDKKFPASFIQDLLSFFINIVHIVFPEERNYFNLYIHSVEIEWIDMFLNVRFRKFMLRV